MRIKKRFSMVLACLCCLLALGTAEGKVKGSVTMDETLREEKGGPRARIVVKGLTDKTGSHRRIAEGMTEMLIGALHETGKFLVLESQALGDLAEEQRIGGFESDYEGADVVLTGALTAFEEGAGGAGAGIGGVAGKLTEKVPFLKGTAAGTHVGYKSAYLASDLRLVDVRSRRILGTVTAEGKAKEFSLSGIGVFVNKVPLVAGLSMYKRTPVEKAIRNLLDESVKFISENTPAEYFRPGSRRERRRSRSSEEDDEGAGGGDAGGSLPEAGEHRRRR